MIGAGDGVVPGTIQDTTVVCGTGVRYLFIHGVGYLPIEVRAKSIYVSMCTLF